MSFAATCGGKGFGALGLGWSSRWALAMEDREGLRVLEIARSGWVMEKRKSTVLKNEK